VTDSLEHSSNFAVSPFCNGHFVPAVCAITPPIFNGTELGQSIVQFYTCGEFGFFFIAQSAQHAHGVFTLQTKPRMHQLIGQISGVGKKEQSFRVQIKTPY
jgi:hypothetical protein